MQNIYKTYAEKLGTTENEIEKIIASILKGNNVEEDLLNLLGYESFDDIVFIIQNRDKIQAPISESVKNTKTVIEVKNEYVEIKIHPETKANIQKLISVDELDENDKKYFKYHEFNPVQSQVFDTAYKTNKNFLVSAPTGCGKTDVALITILRALKYEGKIVFIVPMKALATEITHKLQSTFKHDSEIKILEYTGDIETDMDELQNANILVATPEKFDVSTRKLNTSFIISLLIIDEIHILHDRRGSVIESIVCRMFRHMELHQRPIRIIGLSATLPNYNDVAKFIKANDSFSFDSSYRPVPLEMNLIGVRKNSGDLFENIFDENDVTDNIEKLKVGESINLTELFTKTMGNVTFIDDIEKKKEKKPKEKKLKEKLNDILVEKMTPFLEKNQQILIFVTSRKETERTKNYLETIFLSKKFGIHHAGLPRKLRLENENYFRNRRLDVLVSTSTLAWGVNLPARCVIVKGTLFYSQEIGAFQNLGILDILQIFGRSGRPQYDDCGSAFLITENSELNNYFNSIRNRTLVESKLLFNFIDILNTEIYLNNIRNLYEAIQWMKSTFLFIRMLKAPLRYGFTKEEIENCEIDKVLADYISIGIRRLSECGLIEADKNFTTNDNIYMMACANIGIHIHDLTMSYNSTFLGRIASFYFISHETIFMWLEKIETLYNEQNILEMLFSSIEFRNIILREDEQHIIKQSCNDFGVPFYETPVCKMFILFCLYKIGVPTYSLSLTCDQTYILKNLERLIVGLKEIIIHFGFYRYFDTVIEIEDLVLKKKIGRKNFIKSKTEIIDLIDILYIKSNANITVIENERESDALSEIYFITHENHFFTSKPEKTFRFRNSDYDEMKLNFVQILYRFGIHKCSSASWSFLGYKQSCSHFKVLNDFNEIDFDAKFITNDSLLMEHENSVEFKITLTEKFFNIFFNKKYTIEYVEIDNVEFKERQKLMTRKIVNRIDNNNALVIVPSWSEVDRTANDMNTLLILKFEQLDAFNVRRGMKESYLKGVIVADYKDVLKNCNMINEDTLIFFKGIQSRDLYYFFDILKIVGDNQCVIYETENIINFFKVL